MTGSTGERPASGEREARVAEPEATDRARNPSSSLLLWVKGIAPLLLLAALVVVFLRVGPVGVLQQAFPPVEDLTIQRITMPAPDLLRVELVNGGPEPVTVAQVMVDDALWRHSVDGDRSIRPLGSRTITIPFAWVEGEPHTVTVVSSTGLTFSRTVDVAIQTPTADARYLGTFALLGLYVGVVPVLLGFLWFPFLRAINRRWLDFFLSLTIGLLVFLGVEALAEALETSATVAAAFQGLGVVMIGAFGAALGLAAVGGSRARQREGEVSPLFLAGLIALGIGLHNLGEGLAIGSAYATGEMALGSFLVIGFLIHNTTEGLGIVAPIAGERPRLRHLALLGLVAGVPTIFGAWIGGLTYSPLWITLFLAVGAGAIAQVVYEVWRLLGRREGGAFTPLNTGGLILGLMLMYITGLLVAA
jgi:ZIP family zinc transporter